MSYFRKGDPLDDFNRLDKKQAKEEEKLPKCDYCGEPIHDYCYQIHGETFCREFLDNQFRKEVEY